MAAISPVTLLFSAIDQASPVVKNLASNLKENLGLVGGLSLAFNQTQQAISSFAAQGKKAYDLLITQNVELQKSIISTQASLVATNKVVENGIEIKDPTKAIQALQQPVENAIAKLRQGSLELSGITSQELIPVFQVIAQQSSSIGASLDESADLALSFASALAVTGVPLAGMRQEISSIVQGQITSDSQLAKSIGLNNEMVNKWRAQGVLVEELTKRLGAFRAANAIQASTLEGVGSNLAEILSEVTRIAGEPLLAPLVGQLNNLYTFLQQNKSVIQEVANSVVTFFLDTANQIGEAITALQPAITTLAEALFTQLSAEGGAAANVVTILTESFVVLVKASAPLLETLSNITLAFAQIANNPIGQLAIQAGILLSIGTSLLPVIGSIATGLTVLVSTVFGAAAAFASAGGGVVGFNAALAFLFPASTAAAGGVSVLTTALATMQATVIPLTLAVVALGSALALIQSERLKDVNEAQEELRKQINESGDRAVILATRLKSLNNIERENGQLTEAQIKRRKALQISAAGELEGLKQKLAAVKAVQTVEGNESQKATQQAQIKELEILIRLLEKQSGGVKTVTQDLSQLGNDYEQLSKKVSNALAQFERPASAEQFKASAKEIVDFTAKQVELGQLNAQQAIAQLNRVRNDSRVELDLRLSAQQAITKIRQSEADKRVSAAEGEQRKIELLIANETISQEEGQKRISASKIQQLKIQLDAVRASIAEEERLRKTQIETQIAGIDKQIAEAEAKRQKAAAGGDKGGARVAGEELAKLQTQRASAQQSLAINTERLSQLKSQEQKFSAEIAQTQAQERQRIRQEQLKDFDERQQILEANYANGLVTEQQFNQQSLTLTRNKINAELAQIKEQRAKLNADDKEGQEALAVREAQLRKQSADAYTKFQEQQLTLVERNQKRATDAIAQSETERLIEIAQFEKANTDKKAEVEQQKLNLTRDRINSELALEEQKLAQLQALPPFTDPQKEENRQSQIRSSRLKTAQLTKSLIDNEVQQREAAYKVIEAQINRQTQQQQNAATAQTQALEQQTRTGELLTKSLESQNRLLELRKDLVSSLAGFYQGELDILKETSTSEKERKQIAETAAQIRLKAVREQAQIEREVLELNLQQKQTALEQEAIQLRIQQIQARAATLAAQADLKKAQANPNATPEEREAAQLKVEAAQANEVGLQARGILLAQQQQLNAVEAQQQKDKQQREALLQDNQARLNLAQSRVSKSQGKQDIEQLRRDVGQQLFNGPVTTGNIRNLGQNASFSGVGAELLQLVAQLQGSAPTPRNTVPQSQFVGAIASTNTPVQRAITPETLQNLLTQQKSGDVNIYISNEINGKDAEQSTKIANNVTQQVRKELYDLGKFLTR